MNFRNGRPHHINRMQCKKCKKKKKYIFYSRLSMEIMLICNCLRWRCCCCCWWCWDLCLCSAFGEKYVRNRRRRSRCLFIHATRVYKSRMHACSNKCRREIKFPSVNYVRNGVYFYRKRINLTSIIVKGLINEWVCVVCAVRTVAGIGNIDSGGIRI